MCVSDPQEPYPKHTNDNTTTNILPCTLTARDDAAHTAQQEELIAAELARVAGRSRGASHRSGALGLGERARERTLASGFHQRREHRLGFL